MLAARGTRKTQTIASAAFPAPDGGPLGHVLDGRLHLLARPTRPEPLDPRRLDLDGVRVDIVAVYPGCDPVLLDAAATAGARGIVLEATGAGNANVAIRDAVRRLVDDGVVVLVSTPRARRPHLRQRRRPGPGRGGSNSDRPAAPEAGPYPAHGTARHGGRPRRDPSRLPLRSAADLQLPAVDHVPENRVMGVPRLLIPAELDLVGLPTRRDRDGARARELAQHAPVGDEADCVHPVVGH